MMKGFLLDLGFKKRDVVMVQTTISACHKVFSMFLADEMDSDVASRLISEETGMDVETLRALLDDMAGEKPITGHIQAPTEAAIAVWCRMHKASSGTARLFFDMVELGMPLFSTDAEAMSWLSKHGKFDSSSATILGLIVTIQYPGMTTTFRGVRL